MFKYTGFAIDVETNLKTVDFVDITLKQWHIETLQKPKRFVIIY